MKEIIEENLKSKRAKFFVLVGALVFLGTIVGAAYAFFIITSSNDATNTTAGGNLSLGTSLVTDTTNLYLNLDSVLMSEANIGTKYYATTESDGAPITNPTLGNGIYTLATVSLNQEGIYNTCTYGYNISATVSTPITDGSDEDIKVTIKGASITGGEKTYTLKQLVEGSQTLTGTFERIEAGYDQTVTIESTMENTNTDQSDFQGNSYVITLTPTTFSCVVSDPLPQYEQLANNQLLYYYGNEYIDITGGWQSDVTTGHSLYTTVNQIDFSDYSKYLIKYSYTWGTSYQSDGLVVGWGNHSEAEAVYKPYPRETVNNNIIIDTLSLENKPYRSFVSIHNSNSTKYTATKETTNLKMYLYQNGCMNDYLYVYALAVLKNDNWQSLCEKAEISAPETIELLLADSSSLATILNNEDAANYMVKQCTGDFMASAVQSSTFRTALQSSRYKSIVEDNEHWSKFLSMTNNS